MSDQPERSLRGITPWAAFRMCNWPILTSLRILLLLMATYVGYGIEYMMSSVIGSLFGA